MQLLLGYEVKVLWRQEKDCRKLQGKDGRNREKDHRMVRLYTGVKVQSMTQNWLRPLYSPQAKHHGWYENKKRIERMSFSHLLRIEANDIWSKSTRKVRKSIVPWQWYRYNWIQIKVSTITKEEPEVVMYHCHSTNTKEWPEEVLDFKY